MTTNYNNTSNNYQLFYFSSVLFFTTKTKKGYRFFSSVGENSINPLIHYPMITGIFHTCSNFFLFKAVIYNNLGWQHCSLRSSDKVM